MYICTCMCVCVCACDVRACVRACMRACVRVCAFGKYVHIHMLNGYFKEEVKIFKHG